MESIDRLKELNASVKDGSKGMLKAGNQLIQQTRDFIKISNAAVKGMNDIVNGAMREIKIAVEHVDDMSAENSKNFDELKAESEKFKIDIANAKKKVMVVDDDEPILAMVKGILGKSYEVNAVKSSKLALQLFYQGYTPDLVLLDLSMPDMGGWEAYEKISDISKIHKVPIAIFTASDDPNDKAHAARIGAVDYIKKPINKDELMERVGRLVK